MSSACATESLNRFLEVFPTVGAKLLVAPSLDMSADGCSVWRLCSPSPSHRCPKEPLMADAQTPRPRYRSIIADSARWDGFVFRPGDVVISTPPKSGTTWMQMLCALLIFDGPE